MKDLKSVFIIFLLVELMTSCQQEREIDLFDGQTLTGWDSSEICLQVHKKPYEVYYNDVIIRSIY